MGLNRCKLSRKQQSRLVEFFVLEVTARSAASVLGIQPNTAALYYRKLRQRIADQLALVEHEVFDGAVELDE
ncbi:MAG TPA: IS1595 family transposase, partial [Pseudoxanthomonas sp.]